MYEKIYLKKDISCSKGGLQTPSRVLIQSTIMPFLSLGSVLLSLVAALPATSRALAPFKGVTGSSTTAQPPPSSPHVSALPPYSTARCVIHPSMNTVRLLCSDPSQANHETKKKGHKHELMLTVGNLDWSVEPSQISDLLARVVGSEEHGTVLITVKALPQPPRSRDEGKRHCGSATIEFATKEAALMGMERLMESQEKKQWRVRWAWISDEQTTARSLLNDEPTPERVLLRKNRAESYARARKRIIDKTDEVIQVSSLAMDLYSKGDSTSDHTNNPLDLSLLPVLEAPRLDWSQCPEIIDPTRGGGLLEGTLRGERKRAAVEAFLHVLQNALLESNEAAADHQPRNVVADLGSGGGNLSLPLAWWLKKHGGSVVAVDIDHHALDLLAQRAETIVGVGIETMAEDLLHLIAGPNDDHSTLSATSMDNNNQIAACCAIVSLHACGSASDLAMSVAISHSLPFAISPCCIGKLNSSRRLVPGRMPPSRTAEISYPRSARLANAISFSDYQLLAAAADYGVGGSNDADDVQELERRNRCRAAKQIVETDRLLWAKEMGYDVRMVELPRIGPRYPKRELLLGAKGNSAVAYKISRLGTTIVPNRCE